MQERLNTLDVAPGIQIPMSEFEFTFARSGGPGGQNVNKVNSKAVLRWRVKDTTSLPDAVKQRFLEKYGTRVTTDGDLIMTSQTYRDQARNVDECLRKLAEMLESVVKPPTPRRPTKPSKAAKIRRAESKSHNSMKKQHRRSPRMDD
jgi:ribosome-associated protein